MRKVQKYVIKDKNKIMVAKTEYGKLIVEKLTEAGINISEAERLLGYRFNKLREMLNGETNINIKDAEAIADLVNDNTLKDKVLLMQSEYQKNIFLKQFGDK